MYQTLLPGKSIHTTIGPMIAMATGEALVLAGISRPADPAVVSSKELRATLRLFD